MTKKIESMNTTIERPANNISMNHLEEISPNPSNHSTSSCSITISSINTNSSRSRPFIRSSVTSSSYLSDHSHLKPGRDGSLLSNAQTINMYRENARKTNNLDTQCEFAIFVSEIATNKQLTERDTVKKEYLSEAEKLFKHLSAKGHANSQYHLAQLYASGALNKSGNPELDKAFPLFVQASKHVHAKALERAGYYYGKGLGCRVNGSKAALFYKKSASLGHPGAMYRLGLAYMNGEIGLSKNPKDAVKWFNRSVEAATAEYPEAIYELALLHITGVPNIIFVDQAYAVRLLNQATELGYAPAAFKLGECYEYGKLDCQPSPALSIHYYTVAAEKAHNEACFALTAWYLVGAPKVLPQSDENAYIWAKRAADMGLPKAEYAVGYFTEMGIGCEKNNIEAIEWYKKAAKDGDKRAAQRIQGKAIAPEKLPSKKKKKGFQDDCKIM